MGLLELLLLMEYKGDVAVSARRVIESQSASIQIALHPL